MNILIIKCEKMMISNLLYQHPHWCLRQHPQYHIYRRKGTLWLILLERCQNWRHSQVWIDGFYSHITCVTYSFSFDSCDATRCNYCSDTMWHVVICLNYWCDMVQYNWKWYDMIWSDLTWPDLMGSECALGTCSSADYVVGWVDYIKEDIICCIYQYISCFRLISHYYYEHYSVNVILIRF